MARGRVIQTKSYTVRFWTSGTRYIRWSAGFPNWQNKRLVRQTPMIVKDQCAVASLAEVMQALDELIAAAKKKNKI